MDEADNTRHNERQKMIRGREVIDDKTLSLGTRKRVFRLGDWQAG
jgi:hypothetical protein